MPEIVLATSNPHKVDELRAILAGGGLGAVRLLGLSEIQPGVALHEPEETGRTFEENATIKALSYARQTSRLCLADDSGLEVDALAGRPGVISSHYSSNGRETGVPRAVRDTANNARVMRELEGVPMEARGARFVCVMVLAGPESVAKPMDPDADKRAPAARSIEPTSPAVLAMTRGTFEGRIGQPGHADKGGVPRGSNGFGYDPLFLVGPEYAQTSAELPTDEKNRLSHRAAAARAMAEQLRALF